MKLVQITNVRVGQIWKNKLGLLVKITNINRRQVEFCFIVSDGTFLYQECEERHFLGDDSLPQKVDFELIGFLNITHKLENNNLVEIPRKEFKVDDVYLEHWEEQVDTDSRSGIISDERELILSRIDEDKLIFNNCLDITEIVILDKEIVRKESGIYKIGILGITHKFINDKLLIKE
jgi:hypothetical protein